MESAIRDPSEYAMVAIMPIQEQLATEVAAEASKRTGKICEVANLNSPKQVASDNSMCSLQL